MGLHRGLEIIGDVFARGQDFRIVGWQPVLLHEASAPLRGEGRQGRPHVPNPCFIDYQGQQIRVREVAVVVSELLAAHGPCDFAVGIPQARFLHDAAARFDDFGLALDFVLNGFFHAAERVEVLDLRARAELGAADRPDGDVGITAQAAFLHVTVADFDVSKNGAQAAQIGAGLRGRADVGFAHDFQQGDAGPVQIHQTRAGLAGVDALARVFFHVDARQAYLFRLPVVRYLHVTVLGDR